VREKEEERAGKREGKRESETKWERGGLGGGERKWEKGRDEGRKGKRGAKFMIYDIHVCYNYTHTYIHMYTCTAEE